MELHVEVDGDEIVVTRLGTEFMAAYRRAWDRLNLRLTRSWIDAISPKVKRLAAEAWLSDETTCRPQKWDGWDRAFIIFGTIAGALGVLIAFK